MGNTDTNRLIMMLRDKADFKLPAYVWYAEVKDGKTTRLPAFEHADVEHVAKIFKNAGFSVSIANMHQISRGVDYSTGKTHEERFLFESIVIQ